MKNTMKIKRLTKKERDELSKIFSLFKLITTYETRVNKICGGFANASLDDYNNNIIYICLKWGVQSDCEDVVHSESWKLNRNILNQKMNIKDKVRTIYE